jgi:hypothetical protein
MSLSLEAKDKARWARIKRVYGITKEQYYGLDLGYCFVCERVWNDRVRPCIDHDHSTGRVRGLLCTFCNRYRVGRFRDPDLVLRIYRYLVRALDLAPMIVPPKKKKRKRKVKKT